MQSKKNKKLKKQPRKQIQKNEDWYSNIPN
jgi:hypothetical protein